MPEKERGRGGERERETSLVAEKGIVCALSIFGSGFIE